MAIYEKWPRSANIASEPAHKVNTRSHSYGKQHHVEATIDIFNAPIETEIYWGQNLLVIVKFVHVDNTMLLNIFRGIIM